MLEDVTWMLTTNIPFYSIDLHTYVSHFEKATPTFFGKKRAIETLGLVATITANMNLY